MGIFTAIFGSKNSRELKKIRPVVDQINGLEPEWQKKSDADLAALTVKFKERIANGEKLDSVLPEASPPCARPGDASSTCATSTCSSSAA